MGQFGFSTDGLARLRHAFCDERQRDTFMALLARAGGQGASLDAPDLARLPKGWPAGSGAAGVDSAGVDSAGADWDHLLRRKHVIARLGEEMPHPDWLFGPDCVPRLLPILANLAPLARGLMPFAG